MRPTDTSIVIIDNYPLQVQVYRYLLKQMEETSEEWAFKISEANCCDSALSLLNKMEAEAQAIDVVFLEVKIPPSQIGGYLFGEDIGVEIRARFQNAKIIVNTSLDTNYRLNLIFKKLKPEGFLIRSDVNWDILKNSLDAVLKDSLFYSVKVLRFIKKTRSHDFVLDDLDRRILYELSMGAKMIELPESLPLSLAAIEKRKRNIKSFFEIIGRGDKELLEKAREYGFI